MTATEEKSVKESPRGKAVVTLVVEMKPALKERLRRLGDLPNRRRKMSAEATIALEQYLEREEAREGLTASESASEPAA